MHGPFFRHLMETMDSLFLTHDDDGHTATQLRAQGYRVAGMHGYRFGELRPLRADTGLPVYRYTLHNGTPEESVHAGTVDRLQCQDRRCTGKFYEYGRSGCADPDAVVTLIMSDNYDKVESMTMETNTSGRHVDALVRGNKDTLQVPTIALPNGLEVKHLNTLCPGDEYCDGFTLSDDRKNVQAFVTGLSCRDQQCTGDLTLVGDNQADYQILLDLDGRRERKAGRCRNPIPDHVSRIRARPRTSTDWTCSS
jgi:hypothetical protein